MNEENNLAKLKGLDSPVCSSLEDTNQNYNNSIRFIFKNYKEGDRVR